MGWKLMTRSLAGSDLGLPLIENLELPTRGMGFQPMHPRLLPTFRPDREISYGLRPFFSAMMPAAIFSANRWR